MKNKSVASINKKHRSPMLSLTTSLRILESTALISLYKMKGSIHLPAVIPAGTSLCKTVCIHMHTGTHRHDIVTMNHAVHNQSMLTSTGIPCMTTRSFVYVVTPGIGPRICHISLTDMNMTHMDMSQSNTRDPHHRDTIVALTTICTTKKGRDPYLGERRRRQRVMYTSRRNQKSRWRACLCPCRRRRLDFTFSVAFNHVTNFAPCLYLYFSTFGFLLAGSYGLNGLILPITIKWLVLFSHKFLCNLLPDFNMMVLLLRDCVLWVTVKSIS